MIRLEVGSSFSVSAQQLARGLRRSLGRALTSGRAEAAREVAQLTGLGVARTKKAFTTTVESPVRGAITARGRPLPLSEFKPRQFKKGVKASPYAKRRLFPGSFMVHGRPTVRDPSRTNPQRPGPLTQHNMGLRPLYGPGIANTFREVAGTPEWRAHVVERVRAELTREISYRVGKGRRR